MCSNVPMALDIAADTRLDPRLRGILEVIPEVTLTDVENREELLAEANTLEAAAGREAFRIFQDLCDEAAPSEGLEVTSAQFVSQPDGNAVNLQIIRPESDLPLACVYYIHGGGMATMSCFDGMYRGWGKHIAANGVAVVMVDFRNCIVASSAPEVEPFPAGLNDCVSGLHWIVAHADDLRIDPSRIVVAGESGGGNLTLATGLKLKRDGDLGLIKGLYALCPYIAGQWPTPECPSSLENEGLLLRLHNNRGRIGYGIEAFERAEPAGLALVRQRGRRHRVPPDRDQRQRMRPSARRGDQLLPAAALSRRRGPLSPDDGDDARDRDLRHRMPGHQPRHCPGHRRLHPRIGGLPAGVSPAVAATLPRRVIHLSASACSRRGCAY